MDLNLAEQKEEPLSPYHIYKMLTAARKELTAVQRGRLVTTTLGETIFVFARYMNFYSCWLLRLSKKVSGQVQVNWPLERSSAIAGSFASGLFCKDKGLLISCLIIFRVLNQPNDNNILVVVNTGDSAANVDVTSVDTVQSNAVLTYYTGSSDAEYNHA